MPSYSISTANRQDNKNDSRTTQDPGDANSQSQRTEAEIEDHRDHDIEQQSEPQLKKSETTTSEAPYSTFTSRQKAIIILAATIGAGFSPFTTNIYFPAITTIANDLGVSLTDVNLTITTYMICQAIAPSFISAIADDFGHRPAYVIGFTVYLAANLGLGLNSSYAGLLVLRCLQSCGSSGLVTLSKATVADIVTSAERGKYISITSISSILAPSVAPIVGGLLADHLGWHSVFWFLLILGGIYFIPLALFFPETNRKLVGNGSIKPPAWNRTLTDVLRDRRNNYADKDPSDSDTKHSNLQPNRRKKFNPLSTISVCLEPSTAILLFVSGIVYASFYAISTSLTVQFHKIYDLDTTQQGLLFIPQAIGTIFATMFNAHLVDVSFAYYARHANVPVSKKRQLDILASKLPIERARLAIVMPMLAVSGVLTIVYGWLVQANVNIWAPIVLLGLLGFTTLSGFSVLGVLIIDLHRDRAATASAASNLVRCLMGAGSAAVVNLMIDAIGVGWCFTIWGCLVTGLSVPLLGMVCWYGPTWRAKRVRVRDEKKLRDNEEGGKGAEKQRKDGVKV